MGIDKKKFNINMESVKSFPKKHPIIFHFLLIIFAFMIIVNVTLLAIDSFTGHGIYAIVPDVKGKTLNEAVTQLENSGFKWEIADSAYSDTYAPGLILDQEPKAESRIKPSRTIYLIRNAVSPREVALPVVVDISYRQGLAMLQGLGFKDVSVKTVSSPYKDLILDIKVNGKDVNPGTRLPLNSRIEISVGSGFIEEELIDSII